jgi:hypothetical protein
MARPWIGRRDAQPRRQPATLSSAWQRCHDTPDESGSTDPGRWQRGPTIFPGHKKPGSGGPRVQRRFGEAQRVALAGYQSATRPLPSGLYRRPRNLTGSCSRHVVRSLAGCNRRSGLGRHSSPASPHPEGCAPSSIPTLGAIVKYSFGAPWLRRPLERTCPSPRSVSALLVPPQLSRVASDGTLLDERANLRRTQGAAPCTIPPTSYA